MSVKPPQTLGSILAAARERKGIELLRAARETHIRPAMLHKIESDDWSVFSHPSYSRLFLRDYAKYLGLTQEEIAPYLPEYGEPASVNAEYLSVFIEDKPSGRAPRSVREAAGEDVPRASKITIIVRFAVALLIAAGCLWGVYHWNQQRSDSTDIDKVLVQAEEVGAEVPEPVQTEPASPAEAPLAETTDMKPVPNSSSNGESTLALEGISAEMVWSSLHASQAGRGEVSLQLSVPPPAAQTR